MQSSACIIMYHIAQKLDGANLDEFYEWLATHQIFPYKPLFLNVSPLKPMINLSSFSLSNFCAIRYVPVQKCSWIRKEVLVPCEASPSNALSSLQQWLHNALIRSRSADCTYINLVLLPYRCFFVKCNVPIHVGHQHIQGDPPLLVFINNLLIRTTTITNNTHVQYTICYHVTKVTVCPIS